MRLAMIFTMDLITTNTEPLIPCQSSHFWKLANCCILNISMAYGFSDHHNRKRKKHAIFSFHILRQILICFLHCYLWARNYETRKGGMAPCAPNDND